MRLLPRQQVSALLDCRSCAAAACAPTLQLLLLPLQLWLLPFLPQSVVHLQLLLRMPPVLQARPGHQCLQQSACLQKHPRTQQHVLHLLQQQHRWEDGSAPAQLCCCF
jgi:hypothetical protein